eukprot:TRINITY_DN69739_c0_g1_i1.p1 TRINITY_DN69739_c0_g1~~TRINITY_DN69739_c0_g1_i1.p1  ORF type:complete len:296 (-),score=43.60 TRINITY_DN69739_c0_g1_i1:74-928(-)
MASRKNLLSPADRFDHYERVQIRPVYVDSVVLFGDKKDVALKNARAKPRKNKGGKIDFVLRPSTEAIEGNYLLGKIVLKPKKVTKKGSSPWLHVVHHESVDGAEVGRFLCSVRGFDGWRDGEHLENVWGRYDWCHHTIRSGDDPNADIYFVSVDQRDRLTGRFILSKDCLESDGYYGLRLVDPLTKLAYAYIFGDALARDELSGDVDEDMLNDTTFEVPFRQFKGNGLEPLRKKCRSSSSDPGSCDFETPSKLDAIRQRVRAKEAAAKQAASTAASASAKPNKK